MKKIQLNSISSNSVMTPFLSAGELLKIITEKWDFLSRKLVIFLAPEVFNPKSEMLYNFDEVYM